MAGNRPEPFRGFRFWVIGDLRTQDIDLLSAGVVDDVGQADVALVLGAAVDEARSHFNHLDYCLMPLLDFSGQPELFPEALWHGDTLSDEALENAVAAVEPVISRLQELPDLRRLPDRAALMALAWAYSRQQEIQACWDPDRPEAVSYPGFRALEPARERLEELAAMGLLERSRFDQVHHCPQCDGSRLNVREECVECRSGHLADSRLVHHYRCAYQAPEEEFVQGRKLLCPKCRQELRHYGVDYDKPGGVSVCRSCGEQNSDPVVGFICMDCGEHTDGEQMPRRKWHHYTLTPEGVAAVRSGMLPRMSLEQQVVEQPGAYAIRDFVVLLRFQLAQSRRYDRPLVAMSLHISNADELARTAGRQDMAQALQLLVEILSSALRQSDALAARGQTLYVLLPETEAKYTQLLSERLEQRGREVMAVHPEVEITHFHDADAIEQLLSKLDGRGNDAGGD